MITNRDLDRQLGSWFEARATSTPPDDLLERSLERVGVTRQRREWLVPDRWRELGGSAIPSARPARIGLVLVALLTVAIVASAVGGLLRRIPSVIVAPPPSPSSSVAPSPSEPSPSPTEQPSPTLSDAIRASAGMFADVTDYLPASETVAWVSTEHALYRTQDAGATWMEIRPQGWSIPAATSLVDADTVFLASSESPGTIAATHDGGASWTETALDVGADTAGPILAFQTARTGSATFIDPKGSNPSRVYQTADGGATWTPAGTAKVPHMADSMGKLSGPVGGFLYESAGKAENKPFDNRFFLSSDGGATWTQYTFPIGTLAPKDGMKQIDGIVRGDDGRILLAIDADNNRHQTTQTVWESGADTATWRLVLTLPKGGVDIQFLSPTTWVLFSYAPSEVRSTVDAGAHWRITTPSISTYYMRARFATPDIGWATVGCHKSSGPVGLCDGKTDAPVLGLTSDGGATWTRIGR